MSRQDALRRLVAGVQADSESYRLLRRLLGEQFAAMLRFDARRLASLAAQIPTLVALLEGRRAERSRLLVTLGLQPASMPAVLALLDERSRPAVAALWQQLEALVHECRALNQRNGSLLAEQHESMRRVIGGEEHTYAPA